MHKLINYIFFSLKNHKLEGFWRVLLHAAFGDPQQTPDTRQQSIAHDVRLKKNTGKSIADPLNYVGVGYKY